MTTSTKNKRRVVVTGMGTVNPIGHDVNQTWANVKAGKSGISEITRFDTTDRKVKLAAEVKDWDVDAYFTGKEQKRMDLVNQYAVAAARMAAADAKLDVEADAERLSAFGSYISSGIGGMETIEREHTAGLHRGFDRISPFFIPMAITNLSASHVAIDLGLHGSCICPVTACAGSNSAIGEAFRAIRDGYLDGCFAGGTEASITPLAIGGFTSMKALNDTTNPERASIPFDAERAGFVMGEGAGVLVLESYDAALARGAKIYAEIVGYGATCDASHITAPNPDGTWAAKAMTDAVADAGMAREAIDYVNAHGTSTPLNDAGETKAIRLAFGGHADALKVSSTKSMTGHLLGASGAIEAIITVKALEEGFVPPTIGYRIPDPACDLDVQPNVGEARELRAAISNSLGFGGHNAVLCFRKWEASKGGNACI